MIAVRGAVPGNVWPAVPTPHGAHLLSLLFQLEQSARLPAEESRRRQFAQLDALLEHARRTVPAYGPRLAAAGLAPGRPLTAEAFARVPLLTREEVQRAGDALYSSATPPEHGRVARRLTSGSTGKPVEVLLTGLTDLFWQAFTLRDHLWHGRDFAGGLASIRFFAGGQGAPPGGTDGSNWGHATEHLVRTGPVGLLDVRATLQQQVDWLAARDPDYLMTYPSLLPALVEEFARRNLKPGRLREVRVFGETLAPSAREAVRVGWGVPVTDVYSCEEFGYLALQGSGGEDYVVQSEGVYLEVLRDDGTPCGPGEVGRVVATGLHNFAMPLIRYEVGDYAEMGEAPAAGAPRLRRILGRVRNLFTMPGGVRRWPTIDLPTTGREALPPVRQFQVVQTAPAAVEVRLAAYRPFTPAEEGLAASWLRRGLACPELAVTFAYVEEIPRGPGGKYEEFVSRVGSGS